MLRLAVPVVLGEIGWSLMSTVDTIMVGALGPVALGAVSLGSNAAIGVSVFGIGLMLGLDTLVSQAFGAGDRADCNHSLKQAVYLALFATAPVMAALNAMPLLFEAMGIHPEVRRAAGPFLFAISWGTLPLLLYSALRRYLQAQGVVRPVMIALISANIVNWAFNRLLIYGYGPIPALGPAGSGWSTALARTYLCAVLIVAVILRERAEPSKLWTGGWRVDWRRMKRLTDLGLPAAATITLEVGVFALAAFLAGRLEPAALAAHQVAINLASLTFMVPLGFSSAGAVTVGHAIGRKDWLGAQYNGWLAILLATAFMSVAGIAFAYAPEFFIRIYSRDARVIELGAALLVVAAVFQVFDGIQASTIGVLRGAGDTRTAMFSNVTGYWIIGLPLGYWLCFGAGMGVVGIWIGLSAGLILVSLAVLWVWARRWMRD